MTSAAIAIHDARLELLRLDSWEGRMPLGRVVAIDAVPGAAFDGELDELFVLARRPDRRTWLVGVLAKPRRDGARWTGEANAAPLFDITPWLDELALPDMTPGALQLLDARSLATLRACARGGGPLASPRRIAAIVDDITRMTARLRELVPDDPLGQGPDAWEQAFAEFREPVPPNAPLGEDELAAIEAAVGAPLPPGYRAYLARIGDGFARPYGGIASLRATHGEITERPFPLAGSWRPPFDNDATHDHAMGNCEQLHTPLPDGAEPSDGCFRIGVDGNHSTVWLVIRGAAEQVGTVWQDDTNTDYAGFEPTGKDFLVYYAELVHGKLERASPPDPVALDELAPAEQLHMHANPWYAAPLFRRTDCVEHAVRLLGGVSDEQRDQAAADLRSAAGVAIRRALEGGDAIDTVLAGSALELCERVEDAIGAVAPRADAVRRGIGGACDDLETFAIAAGRCERAEELARRALGHTCHYRANHAVHLQVARALRGAPPDPSVELADPKYDLRSGFMRMLLAQLAPEAIERILAALPPELALEWLVWKTIKNGYLIDLPDPCARVANLLDGIAARVSGGAIARVEHSPICELLFPDRGVRHFLEQLGKRALTAGERADLARAWHTYSLLLCTSTRLWDERYVGEAIAAARELGMIDADWIAEARRELDTDELAPAYRDKLERALPRIATSGPTAAKSLRIAATTLTDRGRAQLVAIAERVAPALRDACAGLAPDDRMRILLTSRLRGARPSTSR